MNSLDEAGQLRALKHMLLDPLLDRLAHYFPLSVMARALLAHALCPKALDDLFRKRAQTQYERHLLFSSVVQIMTLVVSKLQPSLNKAFKAVQDVLPVSLQAVYAKINNTEPAVVEAFVNHCSTRLLNVMEHLGVPQSVPLPGYRVRVIDGNHFEHTQRRLKAIKGSVAGPLPGQALVVYDMASGLATDMIGCEDAHAQERSLFHDWYALIAPQDCFIADRNFCTTEALYQIARRQAFFVIREHQALPLSTDGQLRRIGTTDTGEVFEQPVVVSAPGNELHMMRRIEVRLKTPTRDGEKEMAILTNLPPEVTAMEVTSLYRKRWSIETMFFEIKRALRGELDTMGYPKASLLGFAIALVSYNILAVIKASLGHAHGHELVQGKVSSYGLAVEIQITFEAVARPTSDDEWSMFEKASPKQMAEYLSALGKRVTLAKYPVYKRGPKKPVPKRTRFDGRGHVSTARLLAGDPEEPAP